MRWSDSDNANQFARGTPTGRLKPQVHITVDPDDLEWWRANGETVGDLSKAVRKFMHEQRMVYSRLSDVQRAMLKERIKQLLEEFDVMEESA